MTQIEQEGTLTRLKLADKIKEEGKWILIEKTCLYKRFDMLSTVGE